MNILYMILICEIPVFFAGYFFGRACRRKKP